MYGSLDISTSGLVAQRTRLDIISANLANKDTILNEKGEYEPFRRRFMTLAAGDPAMNSDLGVHVGSLQEQQGQMTLIDAESRRTWSRALEAADSLRDRFGESAVGLAAAMRHGRRERVHENPAGLAGGEKTPDGS